MLAGTKIDVALGKSEVLPSIDFETYSAAGYHLGDKVTGVGSQGKGGLPVVGTPVYAEHPTAEVLCLAYNMKDSHGPRLWVPGLPSPIELLTHVRWGGLVEAHNATFEFYIWNIVCTRLYGWPPLPITQCRCSAAKARHFSLPGGLKAAAAVLGTTPKDPRGDLLIRKLTRPNTPTRNRPTYRRTPDTDWGDFVALYEYCKQDTVAEDEISARVPDLTPHELAIWHLDQTINARGVQVDTQTLAAALTILDEALLKYNTLLQQVTEGQVETVNQNARFIKWVREQGVETNSLGEDARRAMLEQPDLSANVRRALDIANTIMGANVKKLNTLSLQVSSDGRLRDQYTYCGAHTGRWTAGGVQLQNLTSAEPESAQCESCNQAFGPTGEHCPRCGSELWHALDGWGDAGVEQAVHDINNGNLSDIERLWGPPVDVLTGCLRGLFVARPGYKLICCDFSSIEAVVAACSARCQWRIDVFNNPDECIYTRSAASITGRPLEYYRQYKAEHGKDHPDRKRVGKIAELASGYGGWIGAWRAFGAQLTDDEIKSAIIAWRAASPEIVNMWGDQYRWGGPGKWDYRPELFGLEGGAIHAIQNPGQCFSVNDATYGVKDDILFCRLPSGRFLYYHRPRLELTDDKLNRGPRWKITFEYFNTNPKKGRRGWGRFETYGGQLFENYVQAVARDIQAEAMLRLDAAGYPIVMHTHDEITVEVPDSPEYTVEAVVGLMQQRPTWADWYPIRADGWEGKRFKK